MSFKNCVLHEKFPRNYKKKVHHRHYYLELLELELELSFSFAVWSMNGSACLVVMIIDDQ